MRRVLWCLKAATVQPIGINTIVQQHKHRTYLVQEVICSNTQMYQ